MIIKNQRQPFPIFYYQNCLCFFPCLPELPILPKEEEIAPSHLPHMQNKFFLNLFKAELEAKHKESYIKEWSEEEDQRLLSLGADCRNWKQLSKEFHGKSAKVCQRRYKKLVKKEKVWPKQDEDMIKKLKEEDNLSWVEIQMVMKTHKAKKIRERYKNYIELEISRERWTLEEDLQLWARVQELGRSWSDIAKHFPCRSSLQIRNRYYKFLQPLNEKIRKKTEPQQFNTSMSYNSIS